jgi:hypothetical protein
VQQAIFRTPGPPANHPAAYQAAAKAQLERDRKTYRAFRDVDQRQHEQAHEQRAGRAVADAEENARLFREDIETLEPEAAGALKACRDAQDRARGAREYARRCRADHERVQGKGTAAEETEALIRADAAEETAYHAEQAAARAEAELRTADEGLAEAREGLTGAEQMLDRVRQQAAIPAAAAPISDATIRACAWLMQRDEIWDQLSDRDRFRVRHAGEPRDMMSEQTLELMLRQLTGGRV